MGILKTSTIKLNGNSENFKDTDFAGQDFEIEIVEMPFSTALSLTKTSTKIEGSEETTDYKDLYIKQLLSCVKLHRGLFSEDGELTEAQAIELFEYHQKFANIIVNVITEISFKKK